MDGFLAFGDVFSIGDKEYVYLGVHDDVVYAALICGMQHSEKLVQQYERVQSSGTNETKLKENVLYCFVVLSTTEFEGRAAHFGKPATDIHRKKEKESCLDEEDIANLKKEIKASRGAPIALKEIIDKL